jgi:hypothetical protein
MKIPIITLVGVLAVLTAGAAISILRQGSQSCQSVELAATFAQWKVQHGKLYATPSENDYRFKVFSQQLSLVKKSNEEYEAKMAAKGEKLSGPMFEMNGFGDLTEEEFSVMYTGGNLSTEEFMETSDVSDAPVDQSPVYTPESNLGVSFVPRVRHQQSCGSCWAFAAMVELERLAFKQHGTYIDLSHQELIDCVSSTDTCDGGKADHAYNYAVSRGGLVKASAYPYLAKRTSCKNTKSTMVKFSGMSKSKYQYFSSSKATLASSKGVLASVTVHSKNKFKYLSATDDIYDARGSPDCSKDWNHFVALLSFSNGVAKVLNSWGTSWGVNGKKRIRPCSSSQLFGSNTALVYPHSF